MPQTDFPQLQACLKHLTLEVRLTLQQKAGRKMRLHRQQAKAYREAGETEAANDHDAMVEMWERACRDLWQVLIEDVEEMIG